MNPIRSSSNSSNSSVSSNQSVEEQAPPQAPPRNFGGMGSLNRPRRYDPEQRTTRFQMLPESRIEDPTTVVPGAGMRVGGVNYQLTGEQIRPVRLEQRARSESSEEGGINPPQHSMFDINWSELADMEANMEFDPNDLPGGNWHQPEARQRQENEHTQVRGGRQHANNDLDDLVTQKPPENCKGGKDLGGRPPKPEDGSDDDEGGGGFAELTGLVQQLAV